MGEQRRSGSPSRGNIKFLKLAEGKFVFILLTMESILVRPLATSVGKKAVRRRTRGSGASSRRGARRSRRNTGARVTNHGCEVEAARNVGVNKIVRGGDKSYVSRGGGTTLPYLNLKNTFRKVNLTLLSSYDNDGCSAIAMATVGTRRAGLFLSTEL